MRLMHHYLCPNKRMKPTMMISFISKYKWLTPVQESNPMNRTNSSNCLVTYKAHKAKTSMESD